MEINTTRPPEEIVDAMVVDYLKNTDKNVLKFLAAVDQLVNNIEFLKDDTWIERAKKVLEKPDHSERIGSQFETTVRKTLRDKACDESEKNGTPFVPPTQDEIMAAVNRKMAERNAQIEKDMATKLAKARAAIRAAATN
jgi:hypothetical protein